jgi:hypothetical protein
MDCLKPPFMLTRVFQSKLSPDQIYLPLHIFLDETKIARFKDGKMYHPCFLRLVPVDSALRNTFKRGGGILIGYVPMVSHNGLGF